LLLLAGLLAGILILIHLMSSPTLFEAPLNLIAPQGQKTTRELPYCSCAAVPARPPNRIWNSTPSGVFLLATGGIDDGTIHAAVVARSTNSDSRADLDIRRLALADARGLTGINSVEPSDFACRLQRNQSLSPPSTGQALSRHNCS